MELKPPISGKLRTACNRTGRRTARKELDAAFSAHMHSPHPPPLPGMCIKLMATGRRRLRKERRCMIALRMDEQWEARSSLHWLSIRKANTFRLSLVLNLTRIPAWAHDCVVAQPVACADRLMSVVPPGRKKDAVSSFQLCVPLRPSRLCGSIFLLLSLPPCMTRAPGLRLGHGPCRFPQRIF
jgi:hypothetical protein